MILFVKTNNIRSAKTEKISTSNGVLIFILQMKGVQAIENLGICQNI